MKKHLLYFFAILLPLQASAQTKVEIDGIWYNLVDKAQQAEVTFKGSNYYEYTEEYSDVITIPATVTYKDMNYSVTTIGDNAFRDCSSLTAITIPESVTSIGNSTFYKCSSLANINIPEGVTSIGYNAFYYCSSLANINIPKSVGNIKALTFKGCSSFTDITIPESVTSIGESAFEKCINLTTVRIPENSQLISIERWAFNACSSLTTIDIPESVTSIGTYVFKDCVSLTTINISENSQLMSIGSYACAGCSSLTSIVLPKILETVNSEAFANCPKLFDVFCHADKLPSTKANAFDGSYPEYATLHVPANALNDYKNTVPWSSFGTIVTVTTDIKNPERTTQDSPFIYDLRGHRVTDLTKGIYIIGGHKVMVKD